MPELIEGDVFKTIVPLSLSTDTPAASVNVSDKMSDKEAIGDNLGDKPGDNAHSDQLLAYLAAHGEINAATAAKLIGRSATTARRLLSQLVQDGVLKAMGANRNRKYKATK